MEKSPERVSKMQLYKKNSWTQENKQIHKKKQTSAPTSTEEVSSDDEAIDDWEPESRLITENFIWYSRMPAQLNNVF